VRGKNFYLAISLCLLKTPGHRGRLPWAYHPKQKELSYRGDSGRIVSVSPICLSFTFPLLPSTNCAITVKEIRFDTIVMFPSRFARELVEFSEVVCFFAGFISVAALWEFYAEFYSIFKDNKK
jgi:hypothetical protein